MCWAGVDPEEVGGWWHCYLDVGVLESISGCVVRTLREYRSRGGAKLCRRINRLNLHELHVQLCASGAQSPTLCSKRRMGYSYCKLYPQRAYRCVVTLKTCVVATTTTTMKLTNTRTAFKQEKAYLIHGFMGLATLQCSQSLYVKLIYIACVTSIVSKPS